MLWCHQPPEDTVTGSLLPLLSKRSSERVVVWVLVNPQYAYMGVVCRCTFVRWPYYHRDTWAQQTGSTCTPLCHFDFKQCLSVKVWWTPFLEAIPWQRLSFSILAARPVYSISISVAFMVLLSPHEMGCKLEILCQSIDSTRIHHVSKDALHCSSVSSEEQDLPCGWHCHHSQASNCTVVSYPLSTSPRITATGTRC